MSFFKGIGEYLSNQLWALRFAMIGEWARWVKIPLSRWRNPVPDDEFDSSLDLEPAAMLRMGNKERQDYLNDITWRRHLAHEKDLARSKLCKH